MIIGGGFLHRNHPKRVTGLDWSAWESCADERIVEGVCECDRCFSARKIYFRVSGNGLCGEQDCPKALHMDEFVVGNFRNSGPREDSFDQRYPT